LERDGCAEIKEGGAPRLLLKGEKQPAHISRVEGGEEGGCARDYRGMKRGGVFERRCSFRRQEALRTIKLHADWERGEKDIVYIFS